MTSSHYPKGNYKLWQQLWCSLAYQKSTEWPRHVWFIVGLCPQVVLLWHSSALMAMSGVSIDSKYLSDGHLGTARAGHHVQHEQRRGGQDYQEPIHESGQDDDLLDKSLIT